VYRDGDESTLANQRIEYIVLSGWMFNFLKLGHNE